MINLERVAFGLIFIFSAIGVVGSFIDVSWYEGIYAREDGFIEWMTVLGLMIGFFLCLYRVVVLKSFRGKLFIFCTIIFAHLYLFGAGEEISWGQRIFDLKSPDFFLNNNSQGETNIHNLVLSGIKLNKLIFGTILGVLIGVYFLILPILYRKSVKIKRIINSTGMPLPRVVHILAYFVLIALTEMIQGGKKGEVLEFGGVWIFVLMTFSPLNSEAFSKKSLD